MKNPQTLNTKALTPGLMDKTPSSPSSSGGRELQCVGRLEIVRPKPVGFLCGSIPVPTDTPFHSFDSALLPSAQEVRAPRYQIIPPETDLNLPPLLHNVREKVLPIAAVRTGKDLPYTSGAITSNLATKGQALAVSGVAEYGDKLDVIAPADILKQIFKIPYSKARLSVAVHRIGQTLVLNAGPDDEEGEKLVRRHKSHSQCPDKSLFLNFAMHSVRMEACDCPPGYNVQSDGRNSSVLPGGYETRERSADSSEHSMQENTSHFVGSSESSRGKGSKDSLKDHHVKKDKYILGGKKSRSKSHEAVKKVTKVKETPRSLRQENDKYRRASNDGFLKVLFWQFHNFRMLLGSDLLIFSNEKYVAVSLHLWDVSRQVTPITWLEAWLDNVMASVPELAICYHQDGVVQGYELLKTDDIFLSKGISEDGSPAFHPHVVQQNGISVLRFLQENCKQDPGAYWLYKSAGEDAIQLFDLSIISQNGPSDDSDGSLNSPPLIDRGRNDSLLSLGTLLYRIAHRLSLSMAPADRARCASFFRKCLDFLDEPDHLVVRALAHEQCARLLLNYHEEPDVASEALIVESKATIVDAGDQSFDFFSNRSESIIRELIYSPLLEDEPTNTEAPEDVNLKASSSFSLDVNMPSSQTIAPPDNTNFRESETSNDQNFISADVPASSPIVQTVDPLSSRLAAIHHVSQAIKSLRWTWQMQNSTQIGMGCNANSQDCPSSVDVSVCACGDTDCIEVCDIREWLPTSKLDDKLWKLVLLLGESYLALGQAYKDDGQLQPALRVVKLACLVYGSMPQHLKNARFISSMVCGSISDIKVNRQKAIGGAIEGKCRVENDFYTSEQLSSTYLFWAKAWTLVGDVYVEFHMVKGKDVSLQPERNPFRRELKMSSEVLKEVKRLNKKLGPLENCSSCSLVNCSCKSDRASSGNSASSSRRDSGKQSKKATAKNVSYRLSEKTVADPDNRKERSEVTLDGGCLRQNKVDIPECTYDTSPGDSAKSTPELLNPVPAISETSQQEPKLKNGGIFKYLQGPLTADDEYNLSASLSCYEAASKALGGAPSHSADLQAVVKKKGWVCNELGRRLLERKELRGAELAFIEAVKSFEEVSDHTNIILINCNLGHGRRTLAEKMASKRDDLMHHASYNNAYNQLVEAAKQEYAESLRYYEAAKVELNALDEKNDSVSSSLKNEVHTQLANTYLRLGMLLATEDTVAKVYGNAFSEDSVVTGVERAKKELRKHEISASDAMREAIKLYESLGELRKQEVAFAFFQLGFVQRDHCLKLLESDQKKTNLSKGKTSGLQRVKQYASLAERNWRKAIDFYGPTTHAMMYLTILIEISDLSLRMSSTLHLNSMLDSAFTTLLEGRHVSKDEIPDSLQNESKFVYTHFWRQMQSVLKKLLSASLSSNTNKSSVKSEHSNSNRPGEEKLRQLYKLSLTPTDFTRLHEIYNTWIS